MCQKKKNLQSENFLLTQLHNSPCPPSPLLVHFGAREGAEKGGSPAELHLESWVSLPSRHGLISASTPVKAVMVIFANTSIAMEGFLGGGTQADCPITILGTPMNGVQEASVP
jgi:hypothetical protein